jgi:hypothetical protein
MGGWLPVAVTASRIRLKGDAEAALVTVSVDNEAGTPA